jgi:hypothetical protein
MRMANIVVVVLGLVGLLLAGWMTWRWRDLPLVAPRRRPEGWRGTLADAARTLGAVVTAGLAAGVLVLGLVGRLVMRLLAATSGDTVQGRLTEAQERVGEITAGGTIGFLVFVGVLGGVLSALGYLAVRRWLPTRAGAAGVIAGVILVGTLGVLDPLAPDNVDFAILGPRWLAIGAVVATGFLFAATLTATAARLDHVVAGDRRRRWLPGAGLVLLIVPPLVLFGAAYVGGRLVARGRLGSVLSRPRPLLSGRMVVGAAALATLTIAVAAAVRIAAGGQ